MRTSSRILISLCLAAFPMGAMVAKPVLAEEILGPSEAAAHLARAAAAAEKCGHLTVELRDELSGYANMAEVVVASEIGVEDVLRVMKQGRENGLAMACGDETEDLALSAMEAARAAMQQANAGTPEIRTTLAEQPAIQIEEEAANVVQVSLSAAGDNAPMQVNPLQEHADAGSTASLAHYTRATAAYYVERRCQHLAHGQAVRFWQQVVASHNSVLSRHDRAAVKRAKAQAMAMADAAGGCGRRTAGLVREGLSIIGQN
jgi:hypothetical protein